MGAQIIRDRFGIPHIYADTLSEGLFAQGYAQAQDRLPTLLTNYLTALGQRASVQGEAFLESDFHKHLIAIPEKASRILSTLPPELKDGLQSFCDGINKFLQEHPDHDRLGMASVTPHMVVALSLWITFQWSYGQVLDELSRYQQEITGQQIGGIVGTSNQWAVAPSRSALGVPIRLIDPHVGWRGEYWWHECHLNVAEVPRSLSASDTPLNVYGFSIAGLPGVALGFNQRVSWSATAGGPDTADAFLLRLSPDRKNYRYDGQWREIKDEKVVLSVRSGESVVQEERIIRRTHLGPIVLEADDVAVSIRSAYDDGPIAARQLLRMATAQNLDQVLEAVTEFAFPPQNLIVATADGDIFYLLNGRTPRRSDRYDFSRPVPGWTSETDWQGFLSIDDLPSLRNPEDGFLQNCNNSPQFICPRSPLTPDRFPHYAYYSHTGPVYRARSDRALELLDSLEKMKVEDAFRIATDTFLPKAKDWVAAVSAAVKGWVNWTPASSTAMDFLQRWNGRADADEVGAGIYLLLRWQYHLRKPELRWDDDDKIPKTEEDLSKLRDAFAAAVEYAITNFGDLPTLGRVQRLRRQRSGDDDNGTFACDLPLSGMQSFAADCLRAIWAGGPDQDGCFRGVGGQSCTSIVVHTDPPQAWSITPFGNSDDPESPHFVDQAPLFSAGQFKPIFFSRKDIASAMEREESVL
ncbi:MAG: penicillin acylase family protein [Armatimonadetes bacterium]|nr:penicillin acylase family protein [Armatimonadota bacterium]MDW8122225.1 penicillin acylase family protein [Armatimonadota bacterium]